MIGRGRALKSAGRSYRCLSISKKVEDRICLWTLLTVLVGLALLNTENPYQSPDYTSSPTSGLAQDATKRTLTWLLFSFCGRIPRRVFWSAIVIATLVHSAAVSLVGSVLPEESLVSIIAAFLLLLAVFHETGECQNGTIPFCAASSCEISSRQPLSTWR
jgi:hypothetical protein